MIVILQVTFARNSLLLRIEKGILVLDSEIFAAAKLVVLVAPVARMRGIFIDKDTHLHQASWYSLNTDILKKKKEKK